MKKNILLLATIAVLVLCIPVATNAATQVYDLNADWSETANPNGAWSYREGNNLMINNPFPWVGSAFQPNTYPGAPVITKITDTSLVFLAPHDISPGFLEFGDVFVNPGANVLWTAPESGTIDISGAIVPVDFNNMIFLSTSWTLSRNGTPLSGGEVFGSSDSYNRSSPYVLSLGSGGAAALQNIPVEAGDQVVLEFGGLAIGLNLTVTLTSNSVDPVAAIEDLAITVVEMNLQNGIENSLDSKLDTALDALVDANVNNDGAACNSLQAFINAVEAQRGNKLTSAQADQLIASAQEIQALLNCGN